MTPGPKRTVRGCAKWGRSRVSFIYSVQIEDGDPPPTSGRGVLGVSCDYLFIWFWFRRIGYEVPHTVTKYYRDVMSRTGGNSPVNPGPCRTFIMGCTNSWWSKLGVEMWYVVLYVHNSTYICLRFGSALFLSYTYLKDLPHLKTNKGHINGSYKLHRRVVG